MATYNLSCAYFPLNNTNINHYYLIYYIISNYFATLKRYTITKYYVAYLFEYIYL